MKELKDLKMKSKADLQKLSSDKLLEETKGAEKKLYTLKMKLAVGELKQTHLLKALKRYIATVRTMIQSSK